ncbi:MAG: hypothetical protein AAB805_00140 [Patescibacteria group bacterium]
MKKYTWLFGVIAVALLLFGGSWFSGRLADKDGGSENPIIAKKGLHWHSKLSLTARGENVVVPPNIGLGAVHNPIHTHDEESDVIHMEFEGIVRQDNVRLKEFFKVWNKQLSAACLLDECGGVVTMRVNGATSTEFGEHVMGDGERIELFYE